MMLHSRRRRAFFLIPLALAMAFVMLALALAMSSESFSILRASSRAMVAERVQAAADAALELGLVGLAAAPQTYAGVPTSTLLAEGPEAYQVVVLRYPRQLPNGLSIPTDCAFVSGVGIRGGAVTATSSALVKLTTSSGVKGLDGIFADTVTLSGGSRVDSYSSTKGVFSVAGSNGTVVTNSSGSGVIQVLGGSQIYGPVTLGTEGRVESGIWWYTVGSLFSVWRDWGCTVGTNTRATASRTLPSVTLPAKPTTESISFNSGATAAEPGTYGQVTISNGAQLVLKGGTYVVDSLVLSGGARITVSGTTPVQLYVKSKVDINNGVTFNTSNQPSMVQMYLADNAKYTQSGGTFVSAVLYAPNSDIVMNNAAQLYGAVVGEDVSLNGSAAVHYDETLATQSVNPGGSSSASAGAGLTVLFRQRT